MTDELKKIVDDLSENHNKLARVIEEQEAMLLNAFQLVKNGKSYGHLKFSDFKELVSKKHDHEGNMIKDV